MVSCDFMGFPSFTLRSIRIYTSHIYHHLPIFWYWENRNQLPKMVSPSPKLPNSLPNPLKNRDSLKNPPIQP